MPPPTRVVRFAWWNLHEFAHHPARDRHAQAAAAYAEKSRRVRDGLGEAFGPTPPDLLAVGETTREAADDLRRAAFPGYDLAYAPRYKRDDGFQVAGFTRGAGWSGPELLCPEIMSPRTRPMVEARLAAGRHAIRFVACHWTALDRETSREAREDLAKFLRANVYNFLHPDGQTPDPTRHVVVLGDLNEEPFARLFDLKLPAGRDRGRARQLPHPDDQPVKRVRLYDAAWRFVGPRRPHPTTDRVAGTYYHDDHGWRTLDHVIVSGGLLGADPPYLDETETRVLAPPPGLLAAGLPRPYDPGDPTRGGVSDHLPVAGRLVVPEDPP